MKGGDTMKKLFLVLVMVALPMVAWAGEKVKVKPHEFTFIETPKIKSAPVIARKIIVEDTTEYLELTVYPKDEKPIIYRVWPCGKIERMEWKEIAPNTERTGGAFSGTSYRWGANTTLTIPSTQTITID
jgi:hypothetical protein